MATLLRKIGLIRLHNRDTEDPKHHHNHRGGGQQSASLRGKGGAKSGGHKQQQQQQPQQQQHPGGAGDASPGPGKGKGKRAAELAPRDKIQMTERRKPNTFSNGEEFWDPSQSVGAILGKIQICFQGEEILAKAQEGCWGNTVARRMTKHGPDGFAAAAEGEQGRQEEGHQRNTSRDSEVLFRGDRGGAPLRDINSPAPNSRPRFLDRGLRTERRRSPRPLAASRALRAAWARRGVGLGPARHRRAQRTATLGSGLCLGTARGPRPRGVPSTPSLPGAGERPERPVICSGDAATGERACWHAPLRTGAGAWGGPCMPWRRPPPPPAPPRPGCRSGGEADESPTGAEPKMARCYGRAQATAAAAASSSTPGARATPAGRRAGSARGAGPRDKAPRLRQQRRRRGRAPARERAAGARAGPGPAVAAAAGGSLVPAARQQHCTQVRSRRLMKELQDIARLSDRFISVELVDESLFDWNVKLHQVDKDSVLWQDMKETNTEFILLNLTFPDNFPFSPPFMRVLSPRLENGYVLDGGAICMELLTPRGWSSAYTVEAVMRQFAASLVKGQGRICRKAGKSKKSFSRKEAEATFKSLVKTHEKYGWVTPPVSDG
nr:ubiquitin-conjugating enzyme E2Q-like protein 1 [Macaca nemestrina]